MDQQFSNSSSSDLATADHNTVPEIDRLQEELRARDDAIAGFKTKVDDLKQENRLLKEQLEKLVERLQHLVVDENVGLQDDERTAVFSEIGEAWTALQTLGSNKTPRRFKLPSENLKDILVYLNRFELDRCELSCRWLRGAVATLKPGENLRDVGSMRIEVITRDEWGRRPDDVLRGHGGHGFGAAYQQYMRFAKHTYTVVAEAFSDRMTLTNGATSATGTMEWSFVDSPQAISHFVALLRNASVRLLSLDIPRSYQIIQALSTPTIGVAVASLTVGRFAPEVGNLAAWREALKSLKSLEMLAVDDIPRDLLSNDFLLAANVMSISLKSRCFRMCAGGVWGWNGPERRRIDVYGEWEYSELCDGLLAFLFRENLDYSAHVELHLPAARVPQDICKNLIERAISSETHYSIDASFVAVNDVDEQLVGFEEHRIDVGDDDCVCYEIHGPHFIVDLKLTIMDLYHGSDAPPTLSRLVELRRYRTTDTTDEN